MVAPHLSSQISPSTPNLQDSSMAESTTPTNNKSDLEKVLAAVEASTTSNNRRFDRFEAELAELKANRTMSTIGGTPFGGGLAASPFTPEALRPGPKASVFHRPLQTPVQATPTARGVSGFLVPITPKASRNKDENVVAFRHLDPHVSAAERIEASRRASDETSDEVRQLKAELWTACLSVVEKENPGASDVLIAEKTDQMLSEQWLALRKDRIARSFDTAHRGDTSKDFGKGNAGKKEWQRKISQSAPSRVLNKLTHGNYMDWVSEIISILAPIQGATEILEGIEHGRGYVEDDPDKETEGYDVRLDLEIGGLVAGSVSAECRGYVVSRQSTGEYRGSVLWRDLVLVMRRGDGVDKATIFEDVIAERQESNEGVRPYAERLRTNFIKLGAINSPLSADDQVMYLLRGLQPRMDTHRVAVRAFRQSGTAYTFDAALSFLLQQEAAASLDRSQAPKRLSLLSRPTANWAAGENQGQVRKFHVIRNSANKGQPGYFNGECRHCHKWGHKQEDCAQRKREIDAGLVDPKHPSAKVAQSGEVEEQEESGSDVEGDIYEVMDANGEVFFARLATGPVGDTDNEANAAVAMMAHSSIAIASKAAVSHPDWTDEDLDSFSEAHIPKNAIKWILDSGATHHMTPRSELLPVRVKAATGAVVHIADGTKANIERRGACIASMFGDGGTEAKNVVLKTVLVVPSFTTNLLSVQRLAEDGWTVKFARTGAELVSPKGERVEIFTEPGTGAPFVMLRTQPVKYIDVKGSARRMGPAMAAAHVAITDRDLDEAAKWHQRMGHLSYHALRILASNPAFARPSRPSPQAFARIIAEEDLCEPCVETKQPLLPFGNSETVPEAKMSDVAFDLVGPFEGNKEFKYAFNLSEAWARMLWSFPIPNKEAATVFAVFKDDVPIEPDQAPIGEWYNADEEDKQLDHEDWTVTLDNGNRDDQVQGQFGEWPALESLLGEDDDDEDLVTNEFTGELSRVNTQQHLPPSVQGTRDAYSQVDDFDEPIGLDDLDRMFEDTPTQVTFEPTVGAVLPAAPQPRRSKRIESQFKALTATIELSLLAASGDEVLQRATEIAARAFSAAIRSTADGVLIEPKSLADAKKRDDWAKWEEATISQQAYIDSIIRRFGMDEANAVDSPMTAALQGLGRRTDGQATAAEICVFASLIGCEMWAAQGTRPDIAYAATVAISSTESEYVAMSEAAREAKWLRTFTTELDFAPRRPTDIFTDSSGAYSLARNPEGHNRLKHIDVHHHFVRELVANQQVSVTQIGTDENAADTFTKVTSLARLQDGMSQLGLGDNRLGRA
ncbi:unnamed protein product [Tilletia caries]|nr:unnamed protein product [Tilletia caries]